MMRIAALFLALTVVLCGAHPALAGEVMILEVEATHQPGLSGGSYQFNVTLEHDDEGWDHYADQWEIWTPDGKTRLGVRVLAHPHVNEMPFTRSLSGVNIPAGVTEVLIRARDSKHGESSHTLLVSVPEPNS